MTRRKKLEPKAGDVFALPLLDGSFGFGQVHECPGDLRAVFFAERVARLDEVNVNAAWLLALQPVFALNVTANRVEDGDWPVLANLGERHQVALRDPAKSQTAGAAENCLSAYHGMYPWDGLHDPRYFEWLLIRGVPLPANRRTKKAFTTTGDGRYQERSDAHVPTLGAALLKVTLMATDGSLLDELRQRLAELGRVMDVQADDDFVTVTVEVLSIETTLPATERMLVEIGIRDDALVEVCAREARAPKG